jgi:hypothetical protein
MKILHCVKDEKFIDSAITCFDEISDIENDFVMVTRKGTDRPFRFIKNRGRVKIISEYDFERMCIDNVKYDVVILHSLKVINCSLTYRIHPNIKVVWFAWGFDIYNLSWPYRSLVKLRNTYRNDYIEYMRQYFSLMRYVYIGYELLRTKFQVSRNFNRTISRIDFFSGVLPCEYDLVKNDKYFRAEEVWFTYPDSNRESIYNIKYNKDIDYIQIGHSGYSLLNHKHVFKLLIQRGITNKKIILPLSYGDKSYINRTIKCAVKLFGDNAIAQTEFVPLSQYYRNIGKVNAAIFDIDRQCAIGNINIALRCGTKVFLPKASVTYNYLKSCDVAVFNIEDELTREELSAPLSEDIARKNKQWVDESDSHNREDLYRTINKIKASMAK